MIKPSSHSAHLSFSPIRHRVRSKLLVHICFVSASAGVASKMLLLLLAVVLTAAWSATANAQTEFGIATSEENLEAKYKKELDHWMLAAYEGDRDAQFKVGVLFTNDQFSEPDYEQAVYWYKQAAHQGHPLAQYNLGHQYLTGQGVNKNENEAVSWWLKAAKQDHPLAQFNIGRATYLGIGLEKDEKEAKRWFERATANGEPKSAAILVELGWDENLDKLLAQAREKANREAAQADLASALASNKPNRADESSDFVSRVTPAESLAQTTTSNASTNNNAVSNNAPTPQTKLESSSEPKQQIAVSENPARDRASDVPVTEREIVAKLPDDVKNKAKEASSGSRLSKLSDTPKTIAKSPNDNPVVSRNQSAASQPKPAPSQVQPTSTSKAVVRQEQSESSTPASTTSESAIGTEFSAPKRSASKPPVTRSVALYSNPGVRSVLIALTKDVRQLNVVKRDNDWTIVTHNNGFPVWVHQDFLELTDDIGTIKGTNVRARSVPIVADETFLDLFKLNETVSVLGKRKGWYRVTSPRRFKAWVKTSELSALESRNGQVAKAKPQTQVNPQAKTPTAPPSRKPATTSSSVSSGPINPFTPSLPEDANEHHDWLFSQQPLHFTIQLASFDEPAGVVAFLDRLSFSSDPRLHQLEAISRGRFWTYFVYGSFSDKATAEATKASIKQNQGLVRIFGKLQKSRCLSWYLSDAQTPELSQYCTNIDFQPK